jgi:hypothetical protein
MSRLPSGAVTFLFTDIEGVRRVCCAGSASATSRLWAVTIAWSAKPVPATANR